MTTGQNFGCWRMEVLGGMSNTAESKNVDVHLLGRGGHKSALAQSSSKGLDDVCPKCGHSRHLLSEINECPWWRYMSRFGDSEVAAAALALMIR